MGVRATLVMGSDGSTSFMGSSQGVTTPEDRTRFLAARRQCDVIIVGGNTARHESYRRTPAPLLILSHSYPDVVAENPKAHWWNLSPVDAIGRAKKEFGSSIFIEGGVSMIRELLSAGEISLLDISVTPMTGGEDRVGLAELLGHFNVVTQEIFNSTIFYSCTEPVRPIT